MQIRVDDGRGAIETPAATVWVDASGIHRLRFKPVPKLTLAHVEAMQAARERLGAAGRGRLVMVELTHRPSPTAEAAAFSKSPAALALTRAMALITPNPLIQTFGNAYLALLRPDYPTRLFRTEDAARAWLDGFGAGADLDGPAAAAVR